MRASTPKSGLEKQAGGLVSIQDLTYAHSTDTTIIPTTHRIPSPYPDLQRTEFKSFEFMFLHS